MDVFGWLVILALAIWSSLGALVICYGSLSLTGKIEAGCLLIVAAAAGLVFCAYHYFPFVIAVKP